MFKSECRAVTMPLCSYLGKKEVKNGNQNLSCTSNYKDIKIERYPGICKKTVLDALFCRVIPTYVD